MKKQPPQIFYKANDLDELKEALNLLPDMVNRPDFPFGDELSFIQVAVVVREVYRRVYPE